MDFEQYLDNTKRKELENLSKASPTSEDLDQMRLFQRHLLDDGLEEFDPFSVIANRGSRNFPYLFGVAKPTSLMSDDELAETLKKAKTAPWNKFNIHKPDGNRTNLESGSCYLNCVKYGPDRGNFVHFLPYGGIENPGELHDYMSKNNIPLAHPIYMWILGTQHTIYAIDNKLIKLIPPYEITAITNPTHAKFLSHWGFEQIDNGAKANYTRFRDKFNMMTSQDPATKAIVRLGQDIYSLAYLEVYGYMRSTNDILDPDFWEWFFNRHSDLFNYNTKKNA